MFHSTQEERSVMISYLVTFRILVIVLGGLIYFLLEIKVNDVLTINNSHNALLNMLSPCFLLQD